MNLAEVLTALLSAEDEAADSVEGAKRKASDLLRETREKFSADQEARLNAARVQAKAIVVGNSLMVAAGFALLSFRPSPLTLAVVLLKCFILLKRHPSTYLLEL